jgi:hypothetical protein
VQYERVKDIPAMTLENTPSYKKVQALDKRVEAMLETDVLTAFLPINMELSESEKESKIKANEKMLKNVYEVASKTIVEQVEKKRMYLEMRDKAIKKGEAFVEQNIEQYNSGNFIDRFIKFLISEDVGIEQVEKKPQ